MSESQPNAARSYLSAHNRGGDDASVDQAWDQDNQQWWNWYMQLAEPERAAAAEAAGMPASSRAAQVPESSPAELEAELAAPYVLSPAAIEAFRRDGYVKLKQVLGAGALASLAKHLESWLVASLGRDHGLAFRSGEMMWLDDPVLRQFVLSERLGRIAAELLGVQGVRLYHDNALSKEAGCGRTPWHFDAHHFPIDSRDIVTAWIPAQPIAETAGPLAFARGMEVYKLVEDTPFSKFDTSYDRKIGELLDAHGVSVDAGAFDLGEVSFHHSLSFHTAGGNQSTEPRMVLANTYFADGARVVESPTMISGDWRKFMPGVEPGQVIDSEYNPVCYPRADTQTY